MTIEGRACGRTPAWVAYLAVGTALCGLYLGVPPLKGSGPLMNLIGLSPVVAILVGVRRHRPRSQLPWQLLALGSALFWLGDLYTYSYPHLLGAEVPFPSLGDGLYVAMYPVMMAGLLLLVRRRNGGRDRNGMIDGLILTVGLSLPSWIALMAPYLHQDDLSVVARFVSVAYPLGDVILIGAAIRLALDAGRREPAFYLLTSSIVALLATDFAYGLLTLHGGYHHQLWLDAGWIASYLLWGAAASASVDGAPRPAGARSRGGAHPLRLALLTCASLVGSADRDRPRSPHRRRRLPRRASRLDHTLRARRRAHGGARAPAGTLARARARCSAAPEPSSSPLQTARRSTASR